ncbi:MAG: hypothetical protein F6K19_37615 [Cyanothece sp. SIO1E1]|nr:hypothetical protein [Cyanothece sp. SIO1E1]
MDKGQPSRYDYRLRIQIPVDSSEATLLEYIKQERHPVFSHKEMVLSALRAYWLPFAYEDAQRQQAEIQPEKLKRLAQDAIYRLKQQALYLQEVFGLGRDLENIWIENNKALNHATHRHRLNSLPTGPEIPDLIITNNNSVGAESSQNYDEIDQVYDEEL